MHQMGVESMTNESPSKGWKTERLQGKEKKKGEEERNGERGRLPGVVSDQVPKPQSTV